MLPVNVFLDHRAPTQEVMTRHLSCPLRRHLRLKQLKLFGNPVDRIHLVIMGRVRDKMARDLENGKSNLHRQVRPRLHWSSLVLHDLMPAHFLSMILRLAT